MKIRYSGPLKSCLANLAQLLEPGSKIYSPTTKKRLCQIVMVPISTLRDWFAKNIIPHGLNLFKLHLLLKMSGYSVNEALNLSPQQWGLLKVMATGVCTSDQVAERFAVNKNTVYNWVFGKHEPSADFKLKIDAFLAENSAELNNRINSWATGLKSVGLEFSDSTVVTNIGFSGGEIVPNSSSISTFRAETINSLAHIIQAAIPLAKLVLTDNFSPEERKKLRDMTQSGQSHGVFDLSNLLNRLCGEKARKEI